MCLYPRIVRNPKYKENKKNGGIIPPFSDHRVTYLPIGCGMCLECKKKKKDEWLVRLTEDVKHNTNGKFVTLTFNNKAYSHIYDIVDNGEMNAYQVDNAIATYAVRHFLERWRKKYKKSLRHFFVTELGHRGTENIHIHGIIWCDLGGIEKTMNEVERIWNSGDIAYGFVWKWKEYRGVKQNYVGEKTANYISKYILKVDEKHKEYRPIILCSPGIGKPYTKTANVANNVYQGEKTKDYYVSSNGRKMSLPIYYRNKIYNEEEREQLWINKLNKNKRYVLGKEIDISKGMEEYWAKLREARKENARMRFGCGHVNWNRLEYEISLRAIKQDLRKDGNYDKKALREFMGIT